ncbi:MAG: right-handed parallel beta-helix repeat-containing protein [Polyangiales bacterium]|nr:right-handed parallel beta-helix repeat-containing protein [Myxococcales bacterium]MCB9656859.1 right-handed parallel beta-helix repeat-containing protein [Sandaracinaceae bacterium]
MPHAPHAPVARPPHAHPSALPEARSLPSIAMQTSSVARVPLAVRGAGFAALFVVAVTGPRDARAQDCQCDHTVALDATAVDGLALGFQPGDRVCVTAGEREFLRFQHVQGSADEPVVILNCGGLVRIHNTTRAYALVFEEDSRFFHLTGTGDPDLTYGFEVSAPAREPYPGVGLWLNGRSTNYEVDHVEVHDTGFAGVMSKTDPFCDGSADQGTFTQRNVWLHDLFVHDTGGEGFYIGSTQANGHSIQCNGSPVVHQPHFLEGIALTDSRIERTGWDGAQIGMAQADCLVARNIIADVGLERVDQQNQGLQIGSFSACEIHENVLLRGPANGIFIIEADDTWVHDNVVVDFDGDAIYANMRDRFTGSRYRFHFNTLVNAGGAAMRVFGPTLGPSEARSNFAVGAGDGISAGGDVMWTAEGNVTVASASLARFVGGADYRLQQDSPARGEGVAVDTLTHDIDGYPRAMPPSAGAYEYRDPSVDVGVTLRDSGVPFDGGGDEGGCGCRVGPTRARTPHAAWLTALALVGVMRTRRRSR